MRKFVALFMVVAMVVASALVFTGCTTSGVTASTKPAESVKAADSSKPADTAAPATGKDGIEPSTPGTFPLVKETVTLKAFAPLDAHTKDYATNEFTKFYEQKTNVHIEWETCPNDAGTLREKRNLLLAGGDYPDIFFGTGITKDEEMIYGPQGVFIPLNSYIEKYGFEIKKMLQEVSIVQSAITTSDGNIYTLPQVNDCYHCTMSQKMWINSAWLKKLNLKMPTTTQEFEDVLMAFKTKDPNGNGKADEIPLSGCIPSWHTFIDGYLTCAFIYTDGDESTARLSVTDDGKVETVVNKPQFKDALAYMNKLYSEGLIDPAAYTQKDTQLLQTGESNPELLGAVTAGWFGCFTSLEGTNFKDYEALPPLKGPNGVQTCANYQYQIIGTGQFAISPTCKNPAVAFAWADGLYSLDAALRYIECGREGYEWRAGSASDIDVRGRQAKWVRIGDTQYAETQNVHYYQVGPSYRSKEYRESWAVPQDPNDPKGYELKLHLATKQYEPFIQNIKNVFPPLYFNKDVVNERTQLNTTLKTYINENIAAFITGQKKISTDWDSYVSELDSMGMPRLLELSQQAYDAVYKK
jgi:putative aldouronate transport system substrate-binding protein